MDAQAWLVDWFATESAVSREVVEAETETDYLQEGWIDSMQFITLISTIEEEFDITFSNDEFQDRSFATIDGLATTVERKVSEGQ